MGHRILIDKEVFLSAIAVYASANLASTRPSKDSSVAAVKWSDQPIK